MNRKEFRKWAAEEIHLLDGSTGVALAKLKGMNGADVPENFIMQNPDAIVSLQSEYIENGTEIVLTPTLGANPEMRGLFACVAGLWCYQFLLINKQGSLLQAYDFFFYTILVARFGQFARGGKLDGGAPGARRAGSPCRPR